MTEDIGRWRIAHADALGARAARHDFRSLLSRVAGDEVDVEAATVVFGELVSNAIEHGTGEAKARLVRAGSEYRLIVADEGEGADHTAPSTPGVRDLRGRGLSFVRALAKSVEPLRCDHHAGLLVVLASKSRALK